MGNCFLIDIIAEDHIHTDITCNIEEPQQKYLIRTVNNRLLGGGYNMFYWTRTSPSSSAIVQPNQTITRHSTDKDKYLVSSWGSNGYARIDVHFSDKNDKLVQTR